jgi:hypothetical protein
MNKGKEQLKDFVKKNIDDNKDMLILAAFIELLDKSMEISEEFSKVVRKLTDVLDNQTELSENLVNFGHSFLKLYSEEDKND